MPRWHEALLSCKTPQSYQLFSGCVNHKAVLAWMHLIVWRGYFPAFAYTFEKQICLSILTQARTGNKQGAEAQERNVVGKVLG